MSAIFKREFRSYFHTFIGELFIGLNILIFGFFFVQYNLLGLSTNVNGALYNTAFIGLVFMIPLLCMRSFSEERRQKTDQLIMTAPVTVGGIVMGKFLAIAAVFSIPTAVILILPPLMGRFGEVPYLWNYADILDYWLYGLMLIAICIFISSLTDNQIISVVVSVVLILACNLLGDLFDSIPVAWLSDLLNATINFSGRLMTIYLGNFDLTSIVYFISVTALFLFLTTQVIQKRRFTVSRANLSVTAYSTAMIAVCIAVVVVLNLVALQIPDDYREVDLTANRIYTIGDDSKRIASEITDDITLYFLAQESDDAMQTKDTTVEKILKSYVNAGSHIRLEYIDPIVNAKFYQRYTDTDPGYSGVIVVDDTNGRSKAVAYADMYQSEIDYQTYQEKTTGYDMEGQITSALQYVTLSEDSLVQAYRTNGHGELPISPAFTKILDNDNIHMEDLELLTAESIPEDAELLIIESPNTDFTPSEADLVIDYISKGGNLLVSATTETQGGAELTNFKKILDWYGVSLSDGLVLDYTPGNYYATFNTPSYLLPDLSSDDPVTSSLRSVGLKTVFLPECLAIEVKATDGITVTPLLTTSEESYLSTDPDQKNAQSFNVGVKAERTLDSGMSTMILYSCGYLFTDEVDNLIAGMNSRLFDNSIDALVTLSTDFVTIPAKPMDSFLTIPMTVANFITVIGFIFIAAVIVIIAGIAVWAVRRKK